MNCCPDGYKPARIVPPFIGFTDYTPTIPKMYWDVKSQEQRIKSMCELINKLICYADMLGTLENESREDILNLMEQFEQFKESGFLDYYEQQLNAWIHENMQEIIETSMKMVFFGLTLDGYFVAYIPESWNDIIFDTVMEYANENYGRLVLSMQVDDTFQVAGQPNLD